MTINRHQQLIRRCIDLALEAAAMGDEPFAALLEVDGEIVISAQNRVLRDRDRTRHAELLVVSQAMQTLDAPTLRRATLYASTEPCVMCAAAIYWSRIPRLVYGCSQQAFARKTGCGFSVPCQQVLAAGSRIVDVIGPVLEEEALGLHHNR